MKNPDIQSLLSEMIARVGKRQTVGLSAKDLNLFSDDSELGTAVVLAHQRQEEILSRYPDWNRLSEVEIIREIGEGYVNFYATETVSPFVACHAEGPWLVTLHGAVLFDCGGYGMLGLGHNPHTVLHVLEKKQVMANVMTPNVAQKDFWNLFRSHVGHTRRDGCPYPRVLCMNSGSEAVGVALRISDARAKRLLDERDGFQNRTVVLAGQKGGFHGRSYRPALASDSSRKGYERYLHSFRNREPLLTVEPNDIAGLRKLYSDAESSGQFIECFLLEPVMGEGSPGTAVSPEFYSAVRELTKAHGSLLIVDSVQAGIRGYGVLSIVDYPGFQSLEAPDLETYSKALSGGQYPFSAVAMTQSVADEYKFGLYGNTMTTNPRGLEVACSVLATLGEALRRNVVDRGEELSAALQVLVAAFPNLVERVSGTGLLVALHLKEDVPVVGIDGVEQKLRKLGINVIHGGKNALRYTPPFNISSKQVQLIVAKTKECLEKL